ncbi:MAG: hypothetical protein PHD97_12065 [Bacteroidales bacterium]|nr:hypothetical protein [Bacteroidales bacterium]
MSRLKALTLVLLAAIIFSCNSEKPKQNDELLADSLINPNPPVTEMQIKEMITAIPNPMEMALILQSSGFTYSDSFINSYHNIKNYTTNFQKALNIGIYGTDLIFMNINDKTSSAVSYIDNIKELANAIKVGQFFDHKTLNRLNENSKNVDSVLYITSSGFDRMTQYLQEQNRNNLSILIGVGTWTESMYFALKYQTAKDQKIIIERIGEQKVVAEKIEYLLSIFKNNKDFMALHEDFVKLKKEYDNVKITYTNVAPTKKVVGGNLTIQDNSTSTVNISKECITNLTKIINQIRNKIIN